MLSGTGDDTVTRDKIAWCGMPPVVEIRFKGHAKGVLAVAFPRTEQVLTGSWDKTAVVGCGSGRNPAPSRHGSRVIRGIFAGWQARAYRQR